MARTLEEESSEKQRHNSSQHWIHCIPSNHEPCQLVLGNFIKPLRSIWELDAPWKEEPHQLVEESAKETVQESSKVQVAARIFEKTDYKIEGVWLIWCYSSVTLTCPVALLPLPPL